MCGRFTIRADRVRVAETMRMTPDTLPILEPRYNVAPTQSILTVREDKEERGGERVAHEVRWGLIPTWAKDETIGNKMINARAETVAEKPAYRKAFRKRRCLIPCDGMYEWPEKWHRREKVSGRTKVVKWPVHIHFEEDAVFALAGLWEGWKKPDGEWLESATIITSEPNSLIEPLHDRMAVVLPQSAWDEWLDPANDDAEALQRLLVPYPPDEMRLRYVSPNVNKAGTEGEHLLATAPEHPGKKKRTLFD